VTAFLVATLALVAMVGTGVTLTNDPERQAVSLSAMGIALTVAFVALQAPDVALSQLAVGAAVVPLMIMLTIRKIRRRK
jgi:uncharacterized MnhB-related membrane protein